MILSIRDLTGSYVELPLHGTGEIIKIIVHDDTGERVALVQTHDGVKLELSLRYVNRWIV